VKGLYKKAEQGELMQFTEIDDPYEEPYSLPLCCPVRLFSGRIMQLFVQFRE